MGPGKTSAAARCPVRLVQAMSQLTVKGLQTQALKKERTALSTRVGAQKKRLPESFRMPEVPDLKPNARSTKSDREMENLMYVGGLRNRQAAVAYNPQMQKVAHKFREELDVLIAQEPSLQEIWEKFRQKGYTGPNQDAAARVRAHLAEIFCCEDRPNNTPPVGKASELAGEIIDAMCDVMGDEEADLGAWIREGAPLGMNVPIPSNSVFPPPANTVAAGELVEQSLGHERCNYRSFEDEPVKAKEEMDEMFKSDFIARADPVALGIPVENESRMALILTPREDGAEKRRIITDMRGSGANARARMPQSAVLPRLLDCKRMLVAMARKVPSAALDDRELAVADFRTAYQHLNSHPLELPALWGWYTKERILFVALAFGLTGAPLIWCRVTAFWGRVAQAISRPEECQMQIFLDDPIMGLLGSESVRRASLYRILTMGGLGVQALLGEGQEGQELEMDWCSGRLVAGSCHDHLTRRSDQGVGPVVVGIPGCRGGWNQEVTKICRQVLVGNRPASSLEVGSQDSMGSIV